MTRGTESPRKLHKRRKRSVMRTLDGCWTDNIVQIADYVHTTGLIALQLAGGRHGRTNWIVSSSPLLEIEWNFNYKLIC